MIRELAALNFPHPQAVDIILGAAGVAVEGSVDAKSVQRIVQEGYVAAAMQVMYEIQAAPCMHSTFLQV